MLNHILTHVLHMGNCNHWCNITIKLCAMSRLSLPSADTFCINSKILPRKKQFIVQVLARDLEECVCPLLIRRAGGTTVSCVLEPAVPNLLHLLSCYYSVKSCSVCLRTGSYFISTFCLCLNASDARSAIFTSFNSPLYTNQNIHTHSLA